MAISPVSSAPVQNDRSDMPKQPQQAKEITTVTTQCDKKHWHDKSCPHTVQTRPAAKEGEPGYLLDKLI